MNLIKLLVPKEKIVGIDISSEKLRMFYLQQDAYGNISIKGRSEVELDDGIIASGEITDKKKLVVALEKLKKTFAPKKLLSNFAVVTIPPNRIYSKILEFPKILDSEQLLEAITTNASDSFPFPLSSCYFDWEIVGEINGKKQVLVSLAKKTLIDAYIEALKASSFELIALETYFLSLERVIDLPESPIALIHLTDEGISSTIYQNKRPYFSQFETWREASAGKPIKNLNDLKTVIKAKIVTLSLYFESKNGSIGIEKALIVSQGFNTDALIKKIGKIQIPIEKTSIKIKSLENSDWLPVAGAAARAFIPRSDDTIISLLPVGTESLYETQKAISFSKSILFFISSLSVFYVSIFIAFFIFITSLEAGLTNQLNVKNSVPISAEYLKMETDTKEFNGYISDISSIRSLSQTDHSELIGKINRLATTGISFSNISINDLAKTINISGISSSREGYKYFKNTVAASDDFFNASLSSSDIAKKSDINFNLTMYIK
ncbi:MAG: pilus assembly protein PilM [Candidatus Paceibacterota bacterium]|jgi:hypothetical protein